MSCHHPYLTIAHDAACPSGKLQGGNRFRETKTCLVGWLVGLDVGWEAFSFFLFPFFLFLFFFFETLV